jgi:Protein of unknown function (DUF4231)
MAESLRPEVTRSMTSTDADPTWARLEDQLGWYDAKSQSCQQAYKRTKLAQLVVAAAVPVLALADVTAVATAVTAAVVVVLEGVQQLYQWQTNWILYRSTAEALKHERFLYQAMAGPYTGKNRHLILAEKIEGLVSQEHAKWTETSQRADGAADRS